VRDSIGLLLLLLLMMMMILAAESGDELETRRRYYSLYMQLATVPPAQLVKAVNL